MSELFRDLAAHAALRLGLNNLRYAHLDSTSFHLDGRYNSATGGAERDEGVVHIRPGYSRDHRPELNQIVLDLIVEHRAGLPLLMEPLSGNSSDQDDFPGLIEAHLGQLELAHGRIDYVVADCALYSAEHLQRLDAQGTRFITRVPETISEAKAAIEAAELERMQPLQEGYRSQELCSSYGGVEQRWLVVFSEAARARAQRSVSKRLGRESKREAKAFRALRRRSFACREDAERALAHFERTTTLWVSLVVGAEIARRARYGGAGRPKAGAQPEYFSYRIDGGMASVIARRDELIQRKSCFILTTNELDRKELPSAELLAAYKGQSQVERGFRFLKDPLFLASSLFVKSEKRIMALVMVMTVCLLVYAALEWRIREGLSSRGQRGASFFPDQKGRPSRRPTARRWVFQYFVGIHVLILHHHHHHLVLNLNEHHRTILAVLGRSYERLYSSHPP